MKMQMQIKMNKKKKFPFNILYLVTAGVLVLLVAACLIAQSGLFMREPKVGIRADNCYRETLHVTTDNDYMPYSFYSQDGYVSGHDVELITIIANDLHMNLDLQFEPWNMGIRSAVEGRTDVLMTCDYLDTFSGTDTLLKTIPVATEEFVVYSKEKIQSIDNMFALRIAVMENGNVAATIDMLDLQDNCVLCKSNEEAMTAVENGEADCVILRYTVGEAILKKEGYRDIASQISIGQSNICFGISKENQDLRDRLNAEIEYLRASGEIDRLREKWLTTFIHTYSLKELLLRNIWIVFLAAFILAGIILLSIRNERKKLQTEQERNQYIRIVENLSNDFECVNFVVMHRDPDDDEAILIRTSDTLARNIPHWKEEKNFSKRLALICSSIVVPENREEFLRNTRREMIRARLAEDEAYFVDFQAIIDGIPRCYQLKFSKVEEGSLEGRAFVCGLHDVDEEVRREIELSEKQKEADALNELLNRYASEYDAVYVAAFSDGRYRTIVERKNFRSESGMTDIDDMFASNAAKYFYEGDREKILKEVEDVDSIQRNYSVGESRSFEYRRLVEDEYEWFRLTIDRISEEELLVGIKNCNDEITQKIAEDKLLSVYDAIYSVNLDRNMIRPARSSRVSKVGAIRQKMNYTELARSFAETVAPQYKSDWIRFSDPEFMRSYMAKEDHREYIYELPGTDRVMRRLCVDVLERANDRAVVILLSFMGIDDERASTIRLHRQLAEQQMKMQESDRIITALSEDFGCVNYVQLKDDESSDIIVNYRTSAHLKEIIPGWDEETNFRRKMLLLEEYLVFEEDKERFFRDTRRDIILKTLEEKDVYFSDFRLDVRGEVRYYQMKFSAVRDHDGLVGVVVGLHSIDEEIRREIGFQKRIAEEQALLNDVLQDEGVFLIDCFQDTRRTFHDRLHGASNYEDKDRYSTTFARYVEEYVCEPDKAMMREFVNPASYLKILGDKKETRINYRDKTTGTQRFYEMRITRFSETEILQSFKENDAKMVNDLLLEKLKENYFAIFGVDLETGLMRSYKDDPLHVVGDEGEVAPLSRVMLRLSSFFEGETRAFFEKYSDAEYIRRRFAKEDRAEYIYKSALHGGQWTDVTGIVLSRNRDGAPSLFCFAFNKLDERAADRQEMKAQLQEALLAAESANHAKTTFLFNMSHDIRTPMNAILGYTDVALRHEDDMERVDDSLRKIRSSGGHLLNLINDILEMSRIESGKLELSEEPVDLRDMIRNVGDMSQALAMQKSINFEVRTGEIPNPYIYADELHFNEVLINIISNAMKYSYEDGTVTCSVEQKGCVLEGRAWYRFVVADNGIGMSEEFLKHIYEEFSREKTSTVSRLEGAGLGLSIVRRIVDLAEGTIDITSSPGNGTTVTVELPARVMDDAAIEEYKKEHNIEDGLPVDISLSGKRVLLVEDNEMNREIAEEILTETGLLVETAEDGDIAVRMVYENPAGIYDFILMDIQMPIMNGYDAARAIRTLPGGTRVPIIAVSANAFEEDKQKSYEAGMNAHIAKPIDVKTLFSTMSSLMR